MTSLTSPTNYSDSDENDVSSPMPKIYTNSNCLVRESNNDYNNNNTVAINELTVYI